MGEDVSSGEDQFVLLKEEVLGVWKDLYAFLPKGEHCFR